MWCLFQSIKRLVKFIYIKRKVRINETRRVLYVNIQLTNWTKSLGKVNTFLLMILLSYEPSFIILNGPDSFLFNLIHLLAASNIHKEIKKKKNQRPGVIADQCINFRIHISLNYTQDVVQPQCNKQVWIKMVKQPWMNNRYKTGQCWG